MLSVYAIDGKNTCNVKAVLTVLQSDTHFKIGSTVIKQTDFTVHKLMIQKGNNNDTRQENDKSVINCPSQYHKGKLVNLYTVIVQLVWTGVVVQLSSLVHPV